MLDYEKGLRKSLRKCFPQTNLKGCWFHYCQAIRRKISTKFKSIMTSVRSNKAFALLYHKILAIPLLPAYGILDVFGSIKHEMKLHDKDGNVDKFLQYFEKEWLQKVIILFACIILIFNLNNFICTIHIN